MPRRRSSPLENPFRVISTPATTDTGEVGIEVTVSSDPTKINRLPIRGDTYQSAAICKVRMTEFKDYVCTNVVGSGEYWTCYFHLNKTQAEKMVPFKTERKFTLQPWDGVLKFLKPIADYGSPLSTQAVRNGVVTTYSAPSYSAQIGTIPGGNRMTKIVRKDYFGPTKFQFRRRRSPIPTGVSVMLPGREAISIPSMLHERIEVERIITRSDQIIGGTGAGASASIDGQVFPSTEPFETWGRHVVVQDQAETESGAFHAWIIKIYPPPEPEVEVR